MSSFGMTASQIASHITASIRNGTLATKPFPYLLSDDVLPPEVFGKLAGDLPSFDDMTPMSQLGLKNVARYDKHLTATLGEIPGRSDPAVWSAVADGLLDPSVESTLRQIFAPYVACAAD